MRKAFTLAEVLITLGIIGVVAVLTLPPLIAKYKERVIIIKLKKVYNTISQAYERAISENGTPDTWGLIAQNDPKSAEIFADKIRPYLNVSKYCGRATGCWKNVTYTYLSGGNYDNPETNTRAAKFVLSDGALVEIVVMSPDCSAAPDACAFICVDINGKSPPNQAAKDLFTFRFLKNRVIPQGTDESPEQMFEANCKITSTGNGCTAWAVINENMEYLRCSNLAWGTKTKCN